MKYVRGFFAFWYDFIVGDAWEVAAGVVLALIALWLALRVGGEAINLIGAILLPLAIVAVLAFSIWRARPSA
jgi:hypothetical protein